MDFVYLAIVSIPHTFVRHAVDIQDLLPCVAIDINNIGVFLMKCLFRFINFILFVSPAPPAPRRPEHSPVFNRGLINQLLQPGRTAHFECQVDGFPPPEILWTRRGHPLVDKTR